MFHRPALRGFTLIELLVVISVIAILSGMVFAGVTIARKSSAKVKTTSLMATLSAAIVNYRTTTGGYPGDPPGTPWDNVIQGQFSQANDWKVSNSENWAGVAARALVDSLTAVGESFAAPTNGIYLADAWKKPLRYRPARLYPFLVNNTSPPLPPIDGEDPPARDSYQLWSIGPNQTDEGGDSTTNSKNDDLVQWAK